jgi:selenocysteine lyase/cysteine desulfurase
MIARRLFLQAAAAVPATAAGAGPLPKPLPDRALLAADPEKYWSLIRQDQFLLPDWRAYLNNGSLGVPPVPVLAAMERYLERSASLMEDEYPRWGYETLEQHRTVLADYLGCQQQELAIVHSATEAMSIIAGGLPLKSGDEVLITDQEHPSGRECWRLRQARDGIAVREIAIPLPPPSAVELADRIISSIGPRTRVLSFSGVTTTTGLVLPVREICQEARRKGVITVVDGAHLVGQMPVRIAELGCDYLAASPHKWMFAPAGSGLLYIRQENLQRLWPSTVTGNWDNAQLGAARFMMVGTNNRAIVEGAVAGVRFAQSIGPEAIYHRIHQLAREVRRRALEFPYLQLLTPDDDRSYAAMVTFRLLLDPGPFRAACSKQRIWIYGGGDLLRVSSHIHTRPGDIERFFSLLRSTLG